MMRILWTLFLLLTVTTGFGNSHIEFQSVGLGKDGNVSCLHFESNGSLWIGFDGQGLAYRESANAVPQFYNKLSGTLPSDVILTCYRDSRHRIWFGTFGDGLFYREGHQFVRGDSLAPVLGELRYVASLVEDADYTMWVATLDSGLYAIRQDGSYRRYTKENSSLPTNNVLELVCHDGHHLYIATSWGICQLDSKKGEIVALTDEKGEAILEQQMIRYLYQDNDTDLWIGTPNGLYRYHPLTRRYTHLASDKDFQGTSVRAITRDHQGNLWYSTDKGVCCLTVIRHQGKADTYQLLTKKTDADILFHVRAIACMPNGQMLFGTSKGLFQAFLAPGEAHDGRSTWFLSPLLWNVLVVLAFIAIQWLLYRRSGGFHRGRKKPLLSTEHIEPSPLSISSLDQHLLDQATSIVEEHMDDTDFSVDELSTALGMSRAYLYKRLTALTGISPSEFIRMIRVKRGKQYLDQSGEAVSQIAWKVGLSPKQFAKYFKDEYGVLPSQYLKQKDAATAE